MPTQLTSTEKNALVRRLNSSDETEHKQAQAELQALIADDARRIQQLQHIVGGTFTIYLLSGISVIPLFIATKSVSSVLLVFPINGAFWGMMYLLSRWKNQAAQNIAFLDIPQAIGPLIEVYASSSFSHSSQIRMALICLLPRLQAADAHVISPDNLHSLYGILYNQSHSLSDSPAADTTFVIAILRALEQIGDKQAIPRVEKLARAARNLQVRTAAQDCLPFLQQRVEQVRVEQTLLRASTLTASPDTLLRPTVATAPTEPQQLLRASHTENDTNSA